MPGARQKLSPAAKRRLRVLYHDRLDLSLAAIGAILGVSAATVSRYAKAQKFVARRTLRRRQAAARRAGIRRPAKARDGRPAPSVDGAAAASRLAEQAGAQIGALDAAVRDGSVEPERAARILASLARTLKTAHSLEGAKPEASDDERDEPAPRGLGALRDLLAARLARLVAQEGAGGEHLGPDGPGAAPAH